MRVRQTLPGVRQLLLPVWAVASSCPSADAHQAVSFLATLHSAAVLRQLRHRCRDADVRAYTGVDFTALHANYASSFAVEISNAKIWTNFRGVAACNAVSACDAIAACDAVAACDTERPKTLNHSRQADAANLVRCPHHDANNIAAILRGLHESRDAHDSWSDSEEAFPHRAVLDTFSERSDSSRTC